MPAIARRNGTIASKKIFVLIFMVDRKDAKLRLARVSILYGSCG
jgi:hypothetical protein